MTTPGANVLSESATNVVENIACRMAQKHAGRISPNHVLPFLPISLGLVKACLHEMIDGSAVTVDVRDNIMEYEFSAYRDRHEESADLDVGTCVACDKDQPKPGGTLLCSACTMVLQKESSRLAEKTGWPAQAVYEHEILFHAAEHEEALPAETLAATSRYTLRGMRRKLSKLVAEHYAEQKLDPMEGLVTYRFPKVNYPRQSYRENMSVIRSYPASVMEEVQTKVTRILFTLGLEFLAMIVLAFCGVPFPGLVLLLLIMGPLTAGLIWRHRNEPEEE